MNTTPQALDIDLDIALIGGGIAGLWLLNRLKQQGYSVALFEHNALGSNQTIASQGMIHGGIKYTLGGALSGASEAIAGMPAHWKACLAGQGDIDLRETRVLSDHFYLWSQQGLIGKLSGFFASKLLHGRIASLPRQEYPALLTEAAGSLYRLEDLVLDVPSLVANLARLATDDIFLVRADHYHLKTGPEGHTRLWINTTHRQLRICARRFIFCAGQGNAALLNSLDIQQPAMQLRPLQQVMLTHPDLPRFYGHCLGHDATPRLTISTHELANGQPVWYLGGSLAEKGVQQTPEDVINTARAELASLLPQVKLTGAHWASLPVSRAEARQPGLARPDSAFIDQVRHHPDILVAWPTKLTLAPILASKTLALLAADQITPDHKNHSLCDYLPTPPLASTPWDQAFGDDGKSCHAL